MASNYEISPATSYGGGLFSFVVDTTEHAQMLDITASVQKVISSAGVPEGICCIFVPHTTCAVTLNENTDNDVKKDMIKELDKVIPWDDNYAHLGGNSAAHIKSSLIGASETLPIHNGKLLLGPWQSLFFVELDGGRTRTVYVKLLRG